MADDARLAHKYLLKDNLKRLSFDLRVILQYLIQSFSPLLQKAFLYQFSFQNQTNVRGLSPFVLLLDFGHMMQLLIGIRISLLPFDPLCF